ncbi:acyltransferase [Jannaschia pagri]|uniref:Acyltransferase n=1 Tax=Jannaschia pagri TaxID=2829797 RepID=A0ABQ4NR40_9RHOB|nr:MULTISPECIES: RraA family protein [unclassified Jannaschia]GIT93008.1 acyltransferase [Jannaschia sp. AI_61]GIT96843.1 acyltransferase [Jannaschia sp. AI_62]
MARRHIPDGLLQRLQQVDTPTVCNAIEVVQGRRGFNRFTRGTMVHCRPGMPAMVGRARTARIAGVAPPTDPPEDVRARRLQYFRAMARGPGPTVAVVEDLDYPNCIAGWWGEVHVAVHKGLGLAGALTNGVMRDLDVIDDGFPILAGSIGPSHGYVHVVDLCTEVSVKGLRVAEDDLVHADRHGAVVIPEDVIGDLAAAIETVFANEATILGPARAPGFSIEVLEAAWAEFERKRT